jgi:hypothetical protein
VHVRWKKKVLASNRQSGEYLCGHFHILTPTVMTPVLVNYKAGTSAFQRTKTGRKKKRRTAHYQTLWRLAPGIRECCLQNPKAQAAWWWEVDQRFEDLASDGIDGHPEVTRAILEARDLIETLLATVVPRPTERQLAEYARLRGDKPRRVKTKIPRFATELGIPWPCTLEELGSTWRRLALEHHPDRGGNQAEFIRMKLAYEAAKKRIDGT